MRQPVMITVDEWDETLVLPLIEPDRKKYCQYLECQYSHPEVCIVYHYKNMNTLKRDTVERLTTEKKTEMEISSLISTYEITSSISMKEVVKVLCILSRKRFLYKRLSCVTKQVAVKCISMHVTTIKLCSSGIGCGSEECEGEGEL